MKTLSNLRRFALGATSLSLVFGLSTACSSGATSTATEAASSAASDAADAAVSGVTLNVNTASEDELMSAFETAGIPNAEKWADEIAEYRPFDNVDQVHEKLKEYNISDDSWTMLSKLITV